MIILKRAGRPSQLFSVKWTFLGSRSSKKVSNDNVVDEQDVSSLAFFAKHRLENRLFKIRTFLFDRLFAKKTERINCLISSAKSPNIDQNKKIRILKSRFSKRCFAKNAKLETSCSSWTLSLELFWPSWGLWKSILLKNNSPGLAGPASTF